MAGAWLGRVVFTTTVVSSALKSMGWNEAEQARVRSVIGRQYAKVGSANLVLLLVFALLEGTLSGFGSALYSEYALLAVLSGLVATHGSYFGRRLVELAEARKEAHASKQHEPHPLVHEVELPGELSIMRPHENAEAAHYAK